MRYESLEDDFNRILRKTGAIESDKWITIPKVNPTPGKKHFTELQRQIQTVD